MKALILALLVATSAFASQPSEINTGNVLALMNAYRAEDGLSPLSIDERLMQAAGDRMRDMEELAYWAHEAPDGRSPFVWLHARGYLYSYAAENLAAGFETAPLLVSSWMESPGHRDNIMSGDFQHCGIAIIEGSTKGPATGKSIVVLFGGAKRVMSTSAR